MTAIDNQHRARSLTAWFHANARELPWRHDRTGYTALVSEAMLQQTQVARVIDAYERFMQRFPDVQSLAAADEQDVLAMWNGLGYYRRARHLHAAARTVVREHHGRIPENADTLLQLPGVGRYTAGAIASIIHGHAVPIVDGNVRRVIARWHADDRQPSHRDAVRDTWQRAQRLVESADDPGPFNEGMMELGARICTPRNPQCDACPVAKWCNARRQGRQDEIPPPKRPPVKQTIWFNTVVIRRRDTILLEQRPSTGLWSNMWQTPTVESTRRLRSTTVQRSLNIPLASCEQIDTFEHATSHRLVHFQVLQGSTRMRKGRWVPLDDLGHLPISNAMRKVLHRCHA